MAFPDDVLVEGERVVVHRHPHWRVLVGPVLAFLLIKVWGIMGVSFAPAVSQTILIMASVPAAVNSVLYAVEFHNCEDFATELVMMSTLLSCITMTGTIYLARILFPVF